MSLLAGAPGAGVRTGRVSTKVDVSLSTDEKVDTEPALKAPLHWGMLFPSEPSGYDGGVVSTRLHLDENGRVVSARIEEASWEGLGQLVQSRLRRCSFSPARVNGQAVPAVVLCRVRFTEVDES